MTGAILWYVIITLTGAVSLPLVFRLFPALPSRGYVIARAFGLLVWGFLFWLLSSLGVLANSAGGYLFAFSLLLAASLWAWRTADRESWRAWFKEQHRFILTAEVLFVLTYTFLLLMRGMEPAALGTEKPMELAFINGFLRSPQMPPLDPWLSGYAISYYYFGYVLVGMLAKLSGVSAGVAFNLGISLVFALSAIGSYGLIYDMLAALPGERKSQLTAVPLLGPLFLLLMGNMEGFLEFLHGRGVFWTQTATGEWTSRFWTWLNLENLVSPPPGNTTPGQLRYWWWWRASRVVVDSNLFGGNIEIIDEFPFFSYFLADLHPHVLAMPFVLVALVFTLNMFLRTSFEGKAFKIFKYEYLFPQRDFLLSIVIFGGLGFLNLWDFPLYAVVFAGAHMLRKAGKEGWSIDRVIEMVLLIGVLGIGGALVYLPFYLSFSSQAGGFYPNVINPTRGIHLWIMFGTLFIPVFWYLIHFFSKKQGKRSFLSGLTVVILVVVLLFAFSLALTFTMGKVFDATTQSYPFLNLYGAESISQLITEGLSRRVTTIGSAVTLIALASAAVEILWPNKQEEVQTELTPPPLALSHQFTGLLILAGALMVITPEFIFLRDFFNNRMNTIFKFYYQAWMLWAMAAAFGSAVLLTRAKVDKMFRMIFRGVFAVVLFIGLSYTVMAVQTRIASFTANPTSSLELDGTANYNYLNVDEHTAVDWLLQAPLGTLAEAIHPQGGSYTTYARISMNSGQPAVLGWVGHEHQWRGSFDEIGSRQADIARLYETSQWTEADEIVQQYGIVYIVVGNLEKSTYNLVEEKFIRNLTPVFVQGSVTIYQTDLLDN
jgi:YYY domain-containing protein